MGASQGNFVKYPRTPHLFFEFDIFDKAKGVFLTLESRLDLLAETEDETAVTGRAKFVRREFVEKI